MNNKKNIKVQTKIIKSLYLLNLILHTKLFLS